MTSVNNSNIQKTNDHLLDSSTHTQSALAASLNPAKVTEAISQAIEPIRPLLPDQVTPLRNLDQIDTSERLEVTGEDTVPLFGLSDDGHLPLSPDEKTLRQRFFDTLELILNEGWQIHKDEDEGSAKPKVPRLPITTKNYVAYGLGSAYTTALAIFLRISNATPLLIEGSTGAMMDNTKTLYKQLKEEKRTKLGFRIAGVVSGVLALSSFYLQKIFPQERYVLPVLNAIPFFDFCAAIFLKTELPKLKLDKMLHAFLESKGINVSKKLIQALYLTVQGAVAMGLMSPKIFGTFVAAAAGVITKEKMRRLIDMVWKEIENINPTPKPGTARKNPEEEAKDRACQRTLLAIAYTTLIGILGTSVFGLSTSTSENPFVNFICSTFLIASADTLVRTAKQTIKTLAEAKDEEPKQKSSKLITTAKNIAKSIAIFGSMGGISFLTGDKIAAAGEASRLNQGINPGVIATMAQETTSVAKVGTKKLMPEAVALSLATAFTVVGAMICAFHEQLSLDPLSRTYGATLFMSILTMSLSLFLIKNRLRGDKPGKTTQMVAVPSSTSDLEANKDNGASSSTKEASQPVSTAINAEVKEAKKAAKKAAKAALKAAEKAAKSAKQ